MTRSKSFRYVFNNDCVIAGIVTLSPVLIVSVCEFILLMVMYK